MTDQRPMRAEIIVVGLGAMGSAAAAEMARRGVRVLGIERHAVAHDLGSSHGLSRRIGQVYPEAPAYVPLVVRAYERWRELEALAGVDLLTETGGLMIGDPRARLVARGLASAEQWGIEHDVLTAREVNDRWPTLTPAPDDVAVFEPHAGFVRPEATVAAQVGLARRWGAELHFGEEVLGWDVSSAGVDVRTSTATYRAGRLVLAPGAWAVHLMQPFGVPLRPERHVQFWFQPSGSAERFAPSRHPVYVWEGSDGTQAYGFPATGGPGEGVKAAFSHGGTPTDPDALRRSVDPAEAVPLLSFLSGRVPELGPAVVRAVPCMYTVTPDDNFVVGFAPGEPKVLLCSPCSGHGFKFAPVIGEVVADLVERGETRFDIGLFDPGRFAAVARTT